MVIKYICLNVYTFSNKMTSTAINDLLLKAEMPTLILNEFEKKWSVAKRQKQYA